jgi:hypothetical protein
MDRLYRQSRYTIGMLSHEICTEQQALALLVLPDVIWQARDGPWGGIWAETDQRRAIREAMQLVMLDPWFTRTWTTYA